MSSTSINNDVQRNVAYGGNTVKAMYYGDDLVWERPDVALYSNHSGDNQLSQNCYLSFGRIEWIEELGKYYVIAYVTFEEDFDDSGSSRHTINKYYSADGISWTREFDVLTTPLGFHDWGLNSSASSFLYVDSYEHIYVASIGGTFSLRKTITNSVDRVVTGICTGGTRTYVFYGSKYIYSTDLVTWSSGTLTGTFSAGTYMRTMPVADGVMVCGDDNVYYINDTGKILTPIPTTGMPLIGGVYAPSINGGTVYVWDGSYRYTYDTATNIVTETVASVLSGSIQEFNGMSYSATLGVFMYKYGGDVYTSSNGIVWTHLDNGLGVNRDYTIQDGINKYVSTNGAYLIIT